MCEIYTSGTFFTILKKKKKREREQSEYQEF